MGGGSVNWGSVFGGSVIINASVDGSSVRAGCMTGTSVNGGSDGNALVDDVYISEKSAVGWSAGEGSMYGRSVSGMPVTDV